MVFNQEYHIFWLYLPEGKGSCLSQLNPKKKVILSHLGNPLLLIKLKYFMDK